MNTHKRIACLLSLLILAVNVRAATFSVTPNVVSNNFSGPIVLNMTGLNPGETVLVQEFFDANSNGVADATEPGIRYDLVTDGQLRLLAGATNINLLRDEDGSTNGAITASFQFANAPDIARNLGQFIFRFSSPSNTFAASNVTFNVKSPAYGQRVQGVVRNNSTNVPNAMVMLVDPNLDDAAGVVVGTVADATGNYSLPAPAGSYRVIASQLGYVGDSLNFPKISLGTNATITTNLNLIAATSTLSGSLAESTNLFQNVLPSAQILAFSSDSLIVIAVSDTNGNFSIPVTASNVWSIRPSLQSAVAEGYLPLAPGFETPFHTSSGPVNLAHISLQHATALVYGTVRDNHGAPIPGISVTASGGGPGGLYQEGGFSDGTGAYAMAAVQGGDYIQVQNAGQPPANNFLFGGTSFYVTNNQALSLDVIGTISTARFRSQIVTDTGAPVTNLFAFANTAAGTSFGNTGASGFLDMPVFAGVWTLNLAPVAGLVFPDVPPFTIVDGVNFTNNIIARTVTGSVSGFVQGSGGVGIPNIPVTITNHVGSTNFTFTIYTDSNGNYTTPVFDGTWNVSLNPIYLEIAGYQAVAPVNVTVPPAGGIANFNPAPIPPPQILTTNLPDGTLNNYYSVTLAATNGVGTLIWSVASGSLPAGLTLDNFGYISGAPTNVGPASFTVQVQDGLSRIDTRTLSINIQALPPPPPVITTLVLPNAAKDCFYSNQLQATNGTTPYSWSLAIDSDPLPAGLTLGTDGTISGTPTTNGYASLHVMLTDSASVSTNAYVYLSVNSPLQSAPQFLPSGVVGGPYDGVLYALGGAQPQTWSIVSQSLPPGLTLNPDTGEITGTNTTLGVYSFTARVTDPCGSVEVSAAITNFTAPTITTVNLPTASLNIPYDFQLQAQGGQPPYSWFTSDALPDGLYLNYDGSITGTPYTASTNTFLVQLYDNLGSLTTQQLTIIATSQPLLDLPAMIGPGQFTFRVTGVSGQSYTLQYATDAVSWAELYTTNAPASIFFLSDTNATNPNRIYRLKVN